jgi:hypothetical protein
VALYFYTRNREAPVKPHSTIYVERHLPRHYQAGKTLTADDVAQLKGLLQRRDTHIERLYGYITQQMQQTERLQNSLYWRIAAPLRWLARKWRGKADRRD